MTRAETGRFRAFWDGYDDQGRAAAAGRYSVVVKNNGRITARTFAVVR
jgi:hypothetical protein